MSNLYKFVTKSELLFFVGSHFLLSLLELLSTGNFGLTKFNSVSFETLAMSPWYEERVSMHSLESIVLFTLLWVPRAAVLLSSSSIGSDMTRSTSFLLLALRGKLKFPKLDLCLD